MECLITRKLGELWTNISRVVVASNKMLPLLNKTSKT